MNKNLIFLSFFLYFAGGLFNIAAASTVLSDSDLINWRYDNYPFAAVGGTEQTWGNVVYDPVNSIWRFFYGRGGTTDAKIYQKTSTDNRTFGNETLALDYGVSGSWDSSRLWEPYVWYETGEARPWRMIYAGSQTGQKGQLGLATSVDGVAWERKDTEGNAIPVLSVTNAANNGSGRIRVTIAGHPWITNDQVSISGVAGTTEANGSWKITYVDSNTFDLQNSTFSNAYTAGGTVSQPVLPRGLSPAWDFDDIDYGSVMKSGSIYYLYYDTVSSPRKTGLATSSDLVHWTKDSNNPFFTGVTDYDDKNHDGTVDLTAGFYCPDVVFWPRADGSDRYVMIIPHYMPTNITPSFDLYVSDSPLFTKANRTYIGQIFTTAGGTNYLQGYQITNADTPRIITDDITRNVVTSTRTGNDLLMVSAVKTTAWNEAMLVYHKKLNGSVLSNIGADLPSSLPNFKLAPKGVDTSTKGLWLPGLTGTLRDLTGGNYNLASAFTQIDSNGILLDSAKSQYVGWNSQSGNTITPLNNITGDFSLETRVSFASDFTTGYRAILGYGNGAGAHHFYVYVGGAAGPSYTLNFTTSTGGVTHNSAVSLGAITLNQIYRIAITRTGGKIYFFKDGVLLNVGGSVFNYTIDSTPNAKFTLGVPDDGTISSIWNGYIDEIRISDAARWTANYSSVPLVYSYQPSGTIFTKVYDFGAGNSQAASINPTLSVPANTAVAQYVRSASSLLDQSTDLDDFLLFPQQNIKSQFQQFALRLTTSDSTQTPAVSGVDIGNAQLPTINSITSTNSASSYKEGDTIHLEINFSEAVSATTTAELVLNTTPAATCAFAVLDSATSSCDYVVRAGDTASVLDVAGVNGTLTNTLGYALENGVPSANLSASKTIIIDTAAPIVSISNFPIVTSLNQGAVLISGACSENGLSVSLNAGGIGAASNCTLGGWSATVDLHTLAEGIITADISQIDGAGNVGSASSTSTKDTVNPTVPGVSSNSTTASPVIISGGRGGDRLIPKTGDLPILIAATTTVAAATISKLQEQIEILKRLIVLARKQLQDKAGKPQLPVQKVTKINGAYSCGEITQNLFYGMKGNQVKCLQELLKERFPSIYPYEVSGYYLTGTKWAVKKIQEKYPNKILKPFNMPQGNGVVGANTRKIINQMLAGRLMPID